MAKLQGLTYSLSKIAVDLDQTLYSFDDKVREAFFDLAVEREDKSILRGAYSGSLEWRSLTDAYGKEIAYEAIERVHRTQFLHEPFLDAPEILIELAKNHKIKYVTSRKDIHWEETYRWLMNWQFPEGDLICTIKEEDYANKGKARHIEDCQYLIDDRPKTIIEFLYEDKDLWVEPRIAFGLWEPYNRNLTDIDGVYLAPTWKCLEYYFKKFNLI